jgi:hypothetical protein
VPNTHGLRVATSFHQLATGLGCRESGTTTAADGISWKGTGADQDEHRYRRVPSDGGEQELQAFEEFALSRIDPIVRRPKIEPRAAIDLGKGEAAT